MIMTLNDAETRVTRGGHILVADDDHMIRALLIHDLEQQGHTVATAQNGRQALQRFEEASFDLLLLDIMMPEMNGYQVLEHIKCDGKLRDIPVIVITAYGHLKKLLQIREELAVSAYLEKPFPIVVLKQKIKDIFAKLQE